MRVRFENEEKNLKRIKKRVVLEDTVLVKNRVKPCTVHVCPFSPIILHKAGRVQFSTATYYVPLTYEYCPSAPITVVGGYNRAQKRKAEEIISTRVSKKQKLGSKILKLSIDNSPTYCKDTGVSWEVSESYKTLLVSTTNTDSWSTLHKLVGRTEEIKRMSASPTVTFVDFKALVASGEKPQGLSRFEKWCYIAEFMEQNPSDLTYVNKIFNHLLSKPEPYNLYDSLDFSETSPTISLGRSNNIWGYF
jgi:hypothetical protein